MGESEPRFIAQAHEDFWRNSARILTSLRSAVIILALVFALTITGTTSDTIYVYNTTSLGPGYYLSLWPSNFNLRPTIALVVSGVVIVCVNVVALVSSKVATISSNRLILTLPPLLGLVAALSSVSFFYFANTSTKSYTLETWSCQWSDIGMDVKPHWGTLCKESKISLYLMAALVPLELLGLVFASWSLFTERKVQARRSSKDIPYFS